MLPAKKKVRDWCPGGGTPVGGCNADRRVRRGRCPMCDQRFELLAVDAEPMNAKPDIHYSIPRHKAY